MGSSLTGIRIGPWLDKLCEKPFWESVRASVVRAGRLRSLVVKGPFADASESDLEPLGQLAGSLEELVLCTCSYDGVSGSSRPGSRLERFPKSLCALTELRRLALIAHFGVTALPAQISSLKKLEVLILRCNLSLLPKELGGLSRLTKLDLHGNRYLGNAPQDEAFPAELGRMKSLRYLSIADCGLRAVPAFVGELRSLETLHLVYNDDLQLDATLDLLVEGCPRLRTVLLLKGATRAGSFWTWESLARLGAFKSKLRAEVQVFHN